MKAQILSLAIVFLIIKKTTQQFSPGPPTTSCSDGGTYLDSSTGNTYAACNVCQPGYFLKAFMTFTSGDGIVTTINTCNACNSPCATCQVTGSNCTSCTGTYEWILGTCAPYCQYGPHCTNCGLYRCKQCEPGWAINLTATPDVCYDCRYIVNCKNCAAGFICTSCIDGYGVDVANSNLSCALCPQQCLTCLTSSKCSVCKTDFYLNFSSGNTSCVPCFATCATCINGPVCKTCPVDLYLNFSSGNKSCVPCLETCGTCGHGPVCVTCRLGFYLNGTIANKSCLPCFQNCVDCRNATYCVTCSAGFQLKIFTSSSSCVYLCHSTCATCQTPPICTTCQPGLYLSNSTGNKLCVPCFENCATCLDGPVCISCNPQFYLDFSSRNTSCVKCLIQNCLKCQDGPQCLQCPSNFILSAFVPWNSCIKCEILHYSQSDTNQCLPCPANCLDCQESENLVICKSCERGFTLDGTNQKCLKCDSQMPKCLQCSSETICTFCQAPFLLGNNNVCDKCQTKYEYVSGYCSKPIGCQSALPDFSKCLACFSQKNFIYDEKTDQCKCKSGFYPSKLTGATECLPKCGDKILIFGKEECDDGNLRNYDGCNLECKIENNFTCTLESPSQCTLHFAPERFLYNYAYRFEGENKCKFSLSLYPANANLKNIDWMQYLIFNVSEDMIVKNSQVITYMEQTNEITIEIEYLKNLEDLIIEFKLSSAKKSVQMGRSLSDQQIEKNNSVMVQTFIESSQSQEISRSVGLSGSTFSDLVISHDISLIVNLNGVNAKLIYEEESILAAYKSAYITSFIITMLILLQFIIGSYFHKMIGLETIQIIQFFYFVRVIIEQKLSTFLNSMNVFKYTAYGGYTNYEAVYGDESEEANSATFMTVSENFVTVGLMKHFSLNVNITLILPALVVVGFLIYLIRKYIKRSQYLKTLEQSEKDQYTVLRRLCQWVYDHFVFTYLNIFNMIVFFSTILYLQSLPNASSAQLEDSQINKFIEKTSFMPHVIILFMTFFIYCLEVFGSYEELQHSRLAEQEKARVPKSMIEKLEHDENNPDRPNYKPGYIFFYLLFYLMVEITLMLNLLIPYLAEFGVEIMLGLSFLYLIFVWTWRPYHQAVEFHNKALKLNHMTMFLFMIGTAVTERIQISVTFYVVFIYMILFMLMVVVICGYLRIVVEYRFRKKLQDNPTILQDEKKKKKEKLLIQIDPSTRKESLLVNNPFVFENQVREKLREEGFLIDLKLTQDQVNEAKIKLRKQIYSDKKRIESIKKANYFPVETIRLKDHRGNYLISDKMEKKAKEQQKWKKRGELN